MCVKVFSRYIHILCMHGNPIWCCVSLPSHMFCTKYYLVIEPTNISIICLQSIVVVVVAAAMVTVKCDMHYIFM